MRFPFRHQRYARDDENSPFVKVSKETIQTGKTLGGLSMVALNSPFALKNSPLTASHLHRGEDGAGEG